MIHVVADGRITESGTHEELLARGGLYSHLYDIQFRKQEQHLEPELIEV